MMNAPFSATAPFQEQSTWSLAPDADRGKLIEIREDSVPVVIHYPGLFPAVQISRELPGLGSDAPERFVLGDSDHIDVTLILVDPDEDPSAPIIDSIIIRQQRPVPERRPDGSYTNALVSHTMRTGKMMRAYRDWMPSREHRIARLLQDASLVVRAQIDDLQRT